MNSNVDADGGFDLRHRALGALVLVVVGVVVLPMILNGASMAPEVVAIDSNDGTKVPRTFETNIRPLNSQDSAVRVESESRDRLKAELSFPESKEEIASPAVEAENAPRPAVNPALDEVPANPPAQVAVAEDSSTASKNDVTLEPAQSSASIDKFEVNEAGDVNEVDENGEVVNSETENAAERMPVVETDSQDSGSQGVAESNAVSNGAGTGTDAIDPDSTESVIEPLPEIVPDALPDAAEKTDVAKIDSDSRDGSNGNASGRSDAASDSTNAVDEPESVAPEEGAEQGSQELPKATGTAGWVVRIGTFQIRSNADPSLGRSFR